MHRFLHKLVPLALLFVVSGSRAAPDDLDTFVMSQLAMLAHLLDDLPIHVEITGTRLQASELLSLVQAKGFSVVCFADLPPSPPSKKKRRSAWP